jgi:tetratricopeptide (TPR) repeat protein
LDTEAALNAEGYRLLQNKKTKEAIEIFQKAVNKYPDSANAYDSLSDAYEADGNKALAIEFAQKALEVLAKDPNMTEELKGRVRDSANDKLKRLRAQ